MRIDIRPWLVLTALVACGGKDEDTDSGNATDTDADTDADTDSDTDADTDADTDTDTDTDTPAPADDAASAVIGAAGGQVALSDVTFDIPAGALGSDVTITVDATTDTTGLPDATTLVSRVFDFGPDGTTFTVPAAISLDVAGAVTSDSVRVVSWHDEVNDVWVDVPSTDDGSTVTANVEHFTRFAVRVVPAEHFVCALPTACGGDPTGTYFAALTCYTPTGTEKHALKDTCADVDVSYGRQLLGGYHFFAGGSYNVDVNESDVALLEVPTSCFATLGVGSCAGLETAKMTCDDTPTGCACTDVMSTTGYGEIGTWQVSGTQLLTSLPSTGPVTYDFCVNPDGSVDLSDARGVTHVTK